MTRRVAPGPAALPDNVVAIGAALDAPVDAPELAREGDIAPFGGEDDDEGLDRPKLPPTCPVKPLGLGTDGQTCWYLNVLGQLVPLGPRDHGKNNLHALFTPRTHLLAKYWPRWSAPKVNRRTGEVEKPSEIVGFQQDEASEALIGACGTAGIFDAQGRVRGRGAHKGRGGALIIHVGDKVMMGRRRINGAHAEAEWYDTGLIDNYVYPWQSSFPLPAECLRLIELLNFCSRSDYQVEGHAILANSAGPLYIRFIADVVEPAQWDDLFVEAFACRLAFQIGPRIVGSEFDKGMAWKVYLSALSQAKRVDARENPQVPFEATSWETARRGGLYSEPRWAGRDRVI